MTTPAIIGRCDVALTGAPRNFAPPAYLFPEVLEIYAQRGETAAPALPDPLSLSVDRKRSQWSVVEIAAPVDAHPDDGGAASPKPARTVIEELARAGRLRFAWMERGGTAAAVPTSREVLTDLQELVDELVPASVCSQGANGGLPSNDSEARRALLSEHFLHLLAHQQIRQLLAVKRAATAPHLSLLITREGKDVAAAPVAQTHRVEGHAASFGHPSVDPWDPSANAASEPSVAASVVQRAPPAELAQLHALLASFGTRWAPRASTGVQTDHKVLCPVGANATSPHAVIPETVPSLALPAVKPQRDPSRSWRLRPSSSSAGGGDAVVLNRNGPLYFGTAAPEGSAWHVALPAARETAALQFAVLGCPTATTANRDGAASESSYLLVNYGRNGLWVDGKWHLHSPAVLRVGSTVRCGASSFVVVAPAPAAVVG